MLGQCNAGVVDIQQWSFTGIRNLLRLHTALCLHLLALTPSAIYVVFRAQMIHNSSFPFIKYTYTYSICCGIFQVSIFNPYYQDFLLSLFIATPSVVFAYPARYTDPCVKHCWKKNLQISTLLYNSKEVLIHY